MRILPHPIHQQPWWYFCPTTIAARVRAIGLPNQNDRLAVIWVRPLDDDELKALDKLAGQA